MSIAVFLCLVKPLSVFLVQEIQVRYLAEALSGESASVYVICNRSICCGLLLFLYSLYYVLLFITKRLVYVAFHPACHPLWSGTHVSARFAKDAQYSGLAFIDSKNTLLSTRYQVPIWRTNRL